MSLFRVALVSILALAASIFTMPSAHAAFISIDVGTVEFGVGPMAFGSGELTGGFGFDTVTRLVSNASFTATGTTGGHDGIYDTPLLSTISSTSLALTSSTGPATSALSLTFSGLDPSNIDTVLLLDLPINGGLVLLGTCMPVLGQPCGLFVGENSTNISVAMHGPGNFQPVPLPASLPLFAAALLTLGVVGRRFKKA